MRIQIYGSTYITEKVADHLQANGHTIVGYVPNQRAAFPGTMRYPMGEYPHDIKLSVQYDRKLHDTRNSYNLHTGLLPEYGGCNVLYHVIRKGEREAGLTFHRMTERLDYGPIVSKITYPVRHDDTVADLYVRMAHLAPAFCLAALSLLPVEGKAVEPIVYRRHDIDQEESARAMRGIKDKLRRNCLKVVATSFSSRRDVREQAEFPHHRQRPADVFAMLELQLSGACDTIIVNNDVGNHEMNAKLDEWARGRCMVWHRDNRGGSFGAYDLAYQLMPNYPYYLFTEDDIIVGGDDYVNRIIDRFESVPNCGFVGLIKVIEHKYGRHACGGVGLTSGSILRRLGGVPYWNNVWRFPSDKECVILGGEVAFTNRIHEMGYALVDFGHNEYWDYEANLCLPFYDWPS